MYRVEESAGGIVLCGDKVLLVYQKSTSSWAFPKGHLKRSEDALRAALREIREESGMSCLSLVTELGRYERPTHRCGSVRKRITMFLFLASGTAAEPQDADVLSCRWVHVADVGDALTYSEDADFFRRHIGHIERVLRTRHRSRTES